MVESVIKLAFNNINLMQHFGLLKGYISCLQYTINTRENLYSKTNNYILENVTEGWTHFSGSVKHLIIYIICILPFTVVK